MIEFKDRIKELRKERNLTQTNVAAFIEKSEGAVRAWESGRATPDFDTLKQLTKYFGCSSDYLIGITDNRYHDKSYDDLNDIINNLDRNLKRANNIIGVISQQAQDFSTNITELTKK